MTHRNQTPDLNLILRLGLNMPAAIKPLMLKVINRDGFVLGLIPVRAGLQTYCGKVVRFTDKSIWCKGESGGEQIYRSFDGRLPCVYKSRAPKDEVIWNAEAAGAGAVS